MLKISDFFGLPIDETISDIHPLLKKLGIEKQLLKTKVVKDLIRQSGRDAAIVEVAIRQQTLKLIKPLLDGELLKYDPSYYAKQVNTSSEHDRLYGAEEKLLDFALLVASTKSPRMMANSGKFINSKQLREAVFKGTRFERCWETLAEEASHIILAYRQFKK